MDKTFCDRALVIKKQSLGEADRVYTLLTEHHGKIKALAKGARKIQSKLAGHAEPYSLVEVMVAWGKGFDKLANCKLVQSYATVSLPKLAQLAFWSDAVDQLIKPHQPEPIVFNLSLNFCQTVFGLDDGEWPMKILLDFHLLKLLAHLGYRPELKACIFCRRKIKPDHNVFSFHSGGLVCHRCQPEVRDKFPVSSDLIKVLRLILTEDFRYLVRVRLNQPLALEIDQVVKQYLYYHLGQAIKAGDFHF